MWKGRRCFHSRASLEGRNQMSWGWLRIAAMLRRLAKAQEEANCLAAERLVLEFPRGKRKGKLEISVASPEDQNAFWRRSQGLEDER